MDAPPPYLPPPTCRRKRSREKRKSTIKAKHRMRESLSATTHSRSRACSSPSKRSRRQRPASVLCESQLINALPSHLITNILFAYLDQSPKQLAAIRGVCRLFRFMVHASFSVLDLRTNISRKANPAQPLTMNMITQFTNLKEVDFSFCDNFTDNHLGVLVAMRSKLRVLNLRGTMVTDEGVVSFFEYERHLNRSKRVLEYHKEQGEVAANTKLEKIGTDETDPRPFLPLEVLDLSKTKPGMKNKITNKSLLAVAYSCPNLKQLSLSMCSGVTDDFLDSVAIFLSKLTFLDVSMTSITSLGCCHLARSPSLRRVDISACPGLSGQSIKALVTGTVCDDSFDETDDNEDLMKQLNLAREEGSASQLTSIAARFAENIDTKTLDILVTRAPNLLSLDMRHYRGNDLKTGLFSPLKMALRNLRHNGVDVAISRVSVYG